MEKTKKYKNLKEFEKTHQKPTIYIFEQLEELLKGKVI